MTPAAGGCQLSAGAARITLAAPCAQMRRKRRLGALFVVDRAHADHTIRHFLHPHGDRLVVVLQREVWRESLPLEESGDTIVERARFSAGVAVNGLPSIVEVKRSKARTFNQVDPADSETEVVRTVFVFDGSRYRPLEPAQAK